MGLADTRVEIDFRAGDVRGGGESRFDGLLVADLGFPREIAGHFVGELRRAGSASAPSGSVTL